MALHNSFKQGQSQQQGTRLAAVPTTEDLTLALAQAGKNSKNPIVVSWKSSKSTLVFWLSVTASSGGTDAEWLLQKGDESGPPKNVWNHKTLDTNLIQSLVSAEEEMALKSTSRAPAAPSLDTLNEQRNNSSGNPDWNTSGSNPNAPIVLGGGPAQPQRPEQTPQAPPQWQGNEASGWNAPQPGPDQLGWGQKPAQKPENVSENSSSNPFAGLKATVEEPKPVNPFNSLMTNPAMTNPALNKPDFSISNQTLPQLPEEDRPGSSLPKDDPSVNPYDALTNSGAGVKQTQPPPPPPPVQPPAPPPSISQSAHAPGQHPRVPDFAAMTSSGAFPVLQVSPDQALNPKNPSQGNAHQNKAPFVINEVSDKAPQTPSSNQSSASQSRADQRNNAPPATPSKAGSKPLPVPVELDRVAVDNVFKTLSHPETGLLTHGSFLFFLVREFSRYQHSHEPFSLIILEMSVMISGSVGGKLPRPLPPRGVRAAAEKICSLTRPLDLVAHYEQSDYAIFLPTTNREQATEFAQSVSKALLTKPLLPDMEPKSLVLHMGVASFPEDTSHPGILLAAAAEAKSAAQQAGKPLLLFADK